MFFHGNQRASGTTDSGTPGTGSGQPYQGYESSQSRKIEAISMSTGATL